MSRNKPCAPGAVPTLRLRFRQRERGHRVQRTRHEIVDSKGQLRAEAFSYQSSYSSVLLGKDDGTKPLEASVVVIPNITKSLVRLLRDFSKAVALGEMKFESLLLICREVLLEFVEHRSGVNLINE